MGINTEVPDAVVTDGNLLILAAPKTAFATYPNVKVADLSAAAAKDITYSLTTTGFNNTITQESISDERLTLASVLAQPGRVTETLELQYVYGGDADVADALFVKDETYVFAVRRAVPHEQAITAGDKFDFLVAKAGVKRPDQETANANFTKTQGFYPQAASQRDVVLSA
jgi:hypothetical protein